MERIIECFMFMWTPTTNKYCESTCTVVTVPQVVSMGWRTSAQFETSIRWRVVVFEVNACSLSLHLSVSQEVWITACCNPWFIRLLKCLSSLVEHVMLIRKRSNSCLRDTYICPLPKARVGPKNSVPGQWSCQACYVPVLVSGQTMARDTTSISSPEIV